MPITFVETAEGRAGPHINCDRCGIQIERAQDGNVYWDSAKAADSAQPFFVHKSCSSAFERENEPEETWASIELQDFPIRIAANLDMAVETAQSADGMFIVYKLKGRILDL